MAEVVAQYQQGAFTTPVNNTIADASVVLSNDNNVRTKHNSHDSDPGIHFQSSALASRPGAATQGRKWLTSDGLRIYYDTGSAWSEVDYLCKTAGGTVTGATTFSNGIAVTTLALTDVLTSTATGSNTFAGSIVLSGDPPLVLEVAGIGEHKWEGGIIESTRTTNNQTAFHYRLKKSRSGGGLQNGDEVFLFAAEPHNGTDYVHVAGIRFEINGTVTGGNIPTRIVFETGETNTFVDRWEIAAAGHLRPITSGAYDVGSTSLRARSVYATETVDLSHATDASHALASLRNTSTGTSAASRFRIGNSTSANAFTVDVFGGSHATLASYVRLINQLNAPLQFGANGDITVAVVPGGGLQFMVTTPPTTLADGQIWWDGTNWKGRKGGATVTIQTA